MKPEEILKVVQEESSPIEEYENMIAKKAINFGVIGGVILCLLLVSIEYLLTKSFDFGKVSIIFLIHGVANFYEGIVRKRKSMIIMGAVDCILTFVFIIGFIGDLLI